MLTLKDKSIIKVKNITKMKGKSKMAKNKKDIKKIGGRILAAILVGMMLLSAVATLIYCLI